jgi:hypothetical protein
MNEPPFERWVRPLSDPASRRQTILASLLGGLVLLCGGHGALAKKKRKKRRKRKKNTAKITFNAFGCVDVGTFCKTNDQCCSGICQGKKGKKSCRAHDEGSCLANQDTCGGPPFFPCTTSTGESGVCTITTGKAPYCNTTGACFPCRKDADCVPFCGSQAACIVCETQCGATEGFTACVGPSEEDACGFPE